MLALLMVRVQLMQTYRMDHRDKNMGMMVQ